MDSSSTDALVTVLASLMVVVGLLGIVVPVLPGLLLVLGGVLVWALSQGSALGWGVFALLKRPS